MACRKVVVIACTFAALGWSAPIAAADATQDQQYIEIIRSNGIGGQDDVLLTYAQQYCANAVDPGLAANVIGQIGLLNSRGVYIVQTAASRVYCPNKIALPPAPPVDPFD